MHEGKRHERRGGRRRGLEIRGGEEGRRREHYRRKDKKHNIAAMQDSITEGWEKGKTVVEVFKKAEECVLYANNVPLGHRKKLEGRTKEKQKARRLALKASCLYDQRSYSQTNYYSESKSFALSCSQSRICLVFTPGL